VACVHANRVSIYSRSTPRSAPLARMASTVLMALSASHALLAQNPLWTRPHAGVLAAFRMSPLSLQAFHSAYAGLAPHSMLNLSSSVLHASPTHTVKLLSQRGPISFFPDVSGAGVARFLAAVQVSASSAPLVPFVYQTLLSAARTALLVSMPRMRDKISALTA
jgi:hypothetical protein